METRPQAVPRTFVSHKELAEAFKIKPRQLTKELNKISSRIGWERKPHQMLYAPVELQKIFSQLGNPFAT